MRKFAFILVLAAICICLNKILGFPLGALFPLIVEYVRFSPEILPIVCVNTSISWMMCIGIRAPNSFEMEHIKVSRVLIILSVRSKLMQKIDSDLLLRVRESTHIAIVAWFDSLWVSLAELDFVLFWVVELFYSVVSSWATITQWTLKSMLRRYYILTDFWSIGTKGASSILLCLVIKEALLRVVLACHFAWLSFEIEQIDESYWIIVIVCLPLPRKEVGTWLISSAQRDLTISNSSFNRRGWLESSF